MLLGSRLKLIDSAARTGLRVLASQHSLEMVAKRLKALRYALGDPEHPGHPLSQEAIQQVVGGPGNNSNWTHYETQRTLIPVDKALKLVTEYRITLDWLYGGYEYGMPPNLMADIRRYMASSPTDGGVAHRRRRSRGA